MKRIGLISDTHGFLHPAVLDYFQSCDEVWHAGDFGSGVAEQLSDCKKLVGVYGNIDDNALRKVFPEQQIFYCEEVKVMMRHIGGYPPKYNPQTTKELLIHRPQLFIAGHSHILKIMFDDKLQCLHINPGAAGNQGWHKVKTLVTLEIDGSDLKNCKLIELP